MKTETAVPFFVRQANQQGLGVRAGVKAGLREHTVKLYEERAK